MDESWMLVSEGFQIRFLRIFVRQTGIQDLWTKEVKQRNLPV